MSTEEDNKPDTGSDELVSQFLAFTGSSDPSTASNYLEMSGNNLDTAVGLYFEHQQAGGGGGGGSSSSRGSGTGGIGSSSSANSSGGGGGFGSSDFGATSASSSSNIGGDILGSDEVRAPDQSRTMRLIDFNSDGNAPPSRSAMSAMAAVNHPAALLASGMLGGGGMMGGVDPDVDSMMSAFASGPIVSSSSAAAAGGTGSGLGIDLTGSGGVPGVFDARAAVNAAAAATAAAAERNQNSSTTNANDDNDDDDDETNNNTSASAAIRSAARAATLSDMFAPPVNIMHRGGGFQGARNVAKDSRRWLIVNLQSDSEFACHALNRDVWRDDLVEGLVKEGFIFWQSTDTVPDGQTYAQRYNVNAFPHVGIIDPRTSRLMWRKEGWTQANPLTATQFAEIAADFCSRHSFDKPPVAPRQTDTNGPSAAAARPAKRAVHELTEQQQLQAAIEASMNDANDDNDNEDDDNSYVSDDMDVEIESDEDEEVVIDDSDDDDDDDEVVCVGSDEVETTTPPPPPAEAKKEEEEKKPPTFEEELVSMDVGDEPTQGKDIARVQIRMPDGKRLVRKFRGGDTVKVIYAFVAQSNEEAKTGKSFVMKAGFPPRDLSPDIDNTIQSCGLAGEAITIRWS